MSYGLFELINKMRDRTNEAMRVTIANGLDYTADTVSVKSVANVSSDTITRPANQTPYSAGDVINASPSETLIFPNVATNAASMIQIIEASIRINTADIPAGMEGFRLHLYTSLPGTLITDNAPFNLPDADRLKYAGYIQWDLNLQGDTTSKTPLDFGDTLFFQVEGLSKCIKLASASTTVWGVLQTYGGFTPGENSTVYTVTLYTKEV